jgi:predicted dehydrogenase
MKKKIGIIGAGAVAEIVHLPASLKCPDIEITGLVDRNLPRARKLAKQFNVPFVTADYRDLFDRVDGVVNGLPHHLHERVSVEFLQKGIGVLIEKPMGLNAEEATRIVETAENHGTPLQVSLKFRHTNAGRRIREMLSRGEEMGKLRSFGLDIGNIYQWPVASGFFFDPRYSGGGVLLDTGSHILDLLQWCIGPFRRWKYSDDSRGGIEAECSLELDLEHGGEIVPGTVEMSRLRSIPGMLRIVGEKKTVEFDFRYTDRIATYETGCEEDVHVTSLDRQGWADVQVVLLRTFGETLQGKEGPATGRSYLPTQELMTACYGDRIELSRPWMKIDPAFHAFAGEKA